MLGFLPWILYWALIGNAPFQAVVLIVLAVAVAVQILGRMRREPPRSLEVGSLVVFVLLAVAAFVFDDAFLERWMQPLSNLGIFLVALVGVLAGRPFVREYAVATVDQATARSDGFRAVTVGMTWLWVGVFAAMTMTAAVPPVVDGTATLRDRGDLLSVLRYWVVPYVLLGLGGLVSGLFPSWFEKRSAMVERREAAEAPGVVTQLPAPADAATAGLVLDVPPRTRHDQPFPVTLHAPARAGVEVSGGSARRRSGGGPPGSRPAQDISVAGRKRRASRDVEGCGAECRHGNAERGGAKGDRVRRARTSGDHQRRWLATGQRHLGRAGR